MLEWLKVKMSTGSAQFRDCCLALDEMQLRPSLEYDKGIDIIVTLITDDLI